MARLRNYTLIKNEKTGNWDLVNDQSDKRIKSFETKGDATNGGSLEQAVGSDGGSVKIQKQNGRFQEKRTYPRKSDPPGSKG